MDKDLLAYLEERFRESAQQLASFREETHQRFDKVDQRFEQVDQRFEQVDRRFEQVDEAGRQTRVMVEDLRGDVQLLAEKMGTFDGKLAALRSELREEIGEVKTLLHLSYGDLNRRIS